MKTAQMSDLAPSTPLESFGRYVLHPAIARGGMATVHTARLVGAEGFNRLVAAKRLHPQFTDDPEFVAMFHDEARIASQIHHPNVVPVLDVVLSGEEVILVQEYVHGVPLSQLWKQAVMSRMPIGAEIVVTVISGVLAGLHAAHEARDEVGEPLGIVHRDVSPQNVLVSVDGIPRLLDFGIAKARTSSHHTRDGVFKGKLKYMAPEQLRLQPVTRSADLYATGVILWELLVNRRFFDGQSDAEYVAAIVKGEIPTLTAALAKERSWISDERWAQLVALEPVVVRAMAHQSENRFATAAEMLVALKAACPAATPIEVSEWVREAGADYLERRERVLASNEESWRSASRITVATPASGIQAIAPPLLVDSSVATAPKTLSIDPGTYAQALAGPGPGRFRQLLPWVLAGALLLVVGVLLGIGAVTSRESPANETDGASAAPAREGSTTRDPAPSRDPRDPARDPSGGAQGSGASPSSPSTASDPTAEGAGAASSGASNAAKSARTPSPSTTYRFLASPRPTPPAPSPPPQPRSPSAAPSWPPSPPAASSKTDCTTPFYFEGTKKIFKPSCL